MIEHKMWYDRPANDWNEALPIGNGAIGGMVFGGIEKELIQLNEESLWYGGYKDRNNKDSFRYLEEIRSLLWEGQIAEAEKLTSMSMFGTPDGQRHYSVLGDLVVQCENQGETVRDYKRSLDLSTGVCEVSYTTENGNYKREIFCSYPEQVLAARFTCSEKEQMELIAYIDRWKYNDEIETLPNGMSLYGISGNDEGIAYRFYMKVLNKGGTVQNIGHKIYAKGCDEVIILITAATDYNQSSPKQVCKKRIKEAEKRGYEELLRGHIADYGSIEGRTTLDLCGVDLSDMPIDKRLERLREGQEDLDLVALYFKFGRYLLMSCSREGGLPATLQGIWNKDWQPPWDSKYTININTQMNYWLAEKCNLSECHLPLFEHLEKVKIHGKETAKSMYGCGGFVAHHNTDIWGDTAPQDMWIPATIWPMGAAWLCLHIWQHYEYTKDRAFLEQKYHLLKGSADFFKDYLMEDENGYLVTGPSTSPENTYCLPSGEKGTLCIGPSMDAQILYELFTAVIEGGKIVGEQVTEIALFEVMRKRLQPIRIGKHGQIMEWREDYEEAEPGHRHISQLFALYPGDQIKLEKTPELAAAAKATLERRLKYGGGHTGWSRAWIINLWARLKESSLAYENVLELLKKSTQNNLLDTHPPFQIDGNFGGTAGIAEMLMQDDDDCIELLPTLPSEWKKGKVTGLCARGGFEIAIAWEEGLLLWAHIKAAKKSSVTVKYRGNICVLDTESKNTIAYKEGKGLSAYRSTKSY